MQTLHVDLASVAIHGQIRSPEPRSDPDTLARDYVPLHQQPDAEWQQELLRS